MGSRAILKTAHLGAWYTLFDNNSSPVAKGFVQLVPFLLVAIGQPFRYSKKHEESGPRVSAVGYTRTAYRIP